jgi:chromosomal replication initiation ATPase DnaA
MEGMNKHRLGDDTRSRPSTSKVVDYGYRAAAERRERLLAASSPAVRARILGKPAALGAGDGPELQGLRREVHALARNLRTLAAEVERLRQAQLQLQPAPSGGVTIADVAARFVEEAARAGYRIDGDRLALGDLQGNRRGPARSRPRLVAMWLCSQVVRGTTLARVGGYFARDYSTVVYARRQIRGVLKQERALRAAALATCRALSVEAPAELEGKP